MPSGCSGRSQQERDVTRRTGVRMRLEGFLLVAHVGFEKKRTASLETVPTHQDTPLRHSFMAHYASCARESTPGRAGGNQRRNWTRQQALTFVVVKRLNYLLKRRTKKIPPRKRKRMKENHQQVRCLGCESAKSRDKTSGRGELRPPPSRVTSSRVLFLAEQQARPPRANHAPTPEHPCGGKGKPKNVLMRNHCPRGEAGTGRRALPRGVGPSRGGTGRIFQPRSRQLVTTQRGSRV